MKCPHCAVEIYDSSDGGILLHMGQDEIAHWIHKSMLCPSCDEAIIRVGQGEIYDVSYGSKRVQFFDECEYLAYPRVERRPPVDNAVPETMRNDYKEACEVSPISPKASAALSRRILQSILEEQGYSRRNLVDQIVDVLNESDSSKSLPASLTSTVDAVRNFGNFSAHPITGENSSQIIDVEPQEAEWCLEIVEQLFEHYYIRPAANENRIAELNEKLADAGKPPIKS